MAEAGTIGSCTDDQFMDYFIIEGKAPKDILRNAQTISLVHLLYHQFGHLVSGSAGTLIKTVRSLMK
jgi:hypothetical protein